MNEKKWRTCAVVAVTLLAALLCGVGIPLLIEGRSLIGQSPGHEFSGYLVVLGVVLVAAGSLLCFVAAAVSLSFLLAGLLSWLSERHAANKQLERR